MTLSVSDVKEAFPEPNEIKETAAWVITTATGGFESVKLQTVPIPELGEYDVLVEMKAATLNFRDLIIPQGLYGFPTKLPVVALSDGAGVVKAIGSRVTQFEVGSRVTTLFNQGHQSGPINLSSFGTGLGGVIDGALRHHAVFPETGLVASPKNLTDLESASLPCAALVAWNCLYGLRPIKAGNSVLVQGTGGVSCFALQFAKAAGCWVVATTSSGEKMEKLKAMGADLVINYKTTPKWGEVAKRASPGGLGIDYVVEVGGAATINQTYAAIKMEGIVSVVGFVGGEGDNPGSPAGHLEALLNLCTLRGVYVGSRDMMLDMIASIEANNIKPVIDPKVFKFEEALKAYEYQAAQKHFGKVAISINES
ncbi:zinc-binding oxidoreductase [Geopyxis carbonaria]|nr:zinc-binding oxidoreductase [Geopyxis carbonaria]